MNTRETLKVNEKGHLEIGGADCVELAREFGTPLYVFDEAYIRRMMRVYRDTLEKETRSCDGIEEYVKDLLEEIQANIYKKALDYRNNRITTVDSYDEFKEKIEEGGFILAHWDGTTETEEKIKEETKATIRCIPFESFVPGDKEPGKCMVTGKPSACRVIFARSY